MELQFMEWINENLHGSSFINWLFRIITCLGDRGIIWIIFTIVLLCFKSYRRYGILLGVSLLFGFILNDYCLKLIITRARPFQQSDALYSFCSVMFRRYENIGFLNTVFENKLPSGYSFPSGHSFSSFNAATILCFINKKKLGIPAYILASLIALSRVFLCVHFPTDILAGAILGVGTALLFIFLFKKIQLKYALCNKRSSVDDDNYAEIDKQEKAEEN